MRSDLGAHLAADGQRLEGDHVGGDELAGGQQLRRTDDDLAGGGVDVDHVAGRAVGRGVLDAQALALADGEAVGALVGADHAAVRVEDLAGRGPEVALEEALGVAVGHEADVVAVRLGGDAESACPGLGPHLLLGLVLPQREQRAAHGVRTHHGQDIGLVLRHVAGAVQGRRAVRAVGADRGVVAGAHGVEAEQPGTVHEGGELDPLVAAHAGVGGAAGGVLGQEVLDDEVVEVVGEVPHVVRDADAVCGTPGVGGVLDGAASPGAGAGLVPVLGQGHVDADDLVARLGRAGRGDGRVDPTTHRCEHLHRPVTSLNRTREVYGRAWSRAGGPNVRCAPVTTGPTPGPGAGGRARADRCVSPGARRRPEPSPACPAGRAAGGRRRGRCWSSPGTGAVRPGRWRRRCPSRPARGWPG